MAASEVFETRRKINMKPSASVLWRG